MTGRHKILEGLAITILSITFHLHPGVAAVRASADSTRLHALETRIDEYLSAIASEPVEAQKKEADFLIETCTDPEIRQSAALMIYRHYRESRIMGLEAVAIHVYDRWFAAGPLEFPDHDERFAARMFSEFNRRSLIGMDAPELELTDSTGNVAEIFGGEWKNGNRDRERYSVLYFYSTDCQKCRLESIVLRNILESTSYPIDFYAIYTGQDRKQWTVYAREKLDIRNSSVKTFHLWDPEIDSDFQMKYGILQTPSIFLVDPEGKIAGRRLDSMSLEALLDSLMKPAELDYGSEESFSFYDKVFAPFGDSISCRDIMSTARYIESSTLGCGDTLMFKQMTGDLLYYLNSRKGEEYRRGQKELIRNYIEGSSIWNTADDSLKIISFASVLDDLLYRAEEGSKIPGIETYGTLLHMKGRKVVETYGKLRLDRLRDRRNIIIFHTEGCPVCKEEIAAAKKMLSKDMSILLIDMDLLYSSFPGQAERLFDTFDLTSLPYITETDSKGIVTGKYMSLLPGKSSGTYSGQQSQ